MPRLLPYQKNYPYLEDYKIEFISEEHSDAIIPDDKWTANIYTIKQKRGGQWLDSLTIDTSKEDIWGGQLKVILDKILPNLNDKSDYKWDDIRQQIVELWHRKQQIDKKRDIAAGGSGQWTSMMDFTFGQLMKFIAKVYGLKFELLKNLPVDLALQLVSKDDLEQQMAHQAFDEVIVKNEIQKIIGLSLMVVEKAERAVDLIINYSSELPYSGRNDLLNPLYNDKTPILSNYERMELKSLYIIFEEYQEQIKNNTYLSPDEKKLKKFDFWDTETGKRLEDLNSRQVHGATLSFIEQEKAKREIAVKISNDIMLVLVSWGLSAKDGQQYYFNLYTKESWKREQKKLELDKFIQKGKSQTELMRTLITGGWDSNTLTFFGVVVGICIGVFFGVFSLIPRRLGFLEDVLISILSAYLIFIIFIGITKTFRVEVIRWVKSILEIGD